MIQRDNIHYSFNQIDGYNKAFNYIVSCREAGKSTACILDKMYKAFKKFNSPTLIINRKIADISEQYILTIQSEINKFADDKVIIEYKLQDLSKGIIPLFICGKQFALLIALNVDINRLKRLKLRNIAYVVFDEFILNPLFNEKYLRNEVDKFKEVYNTFQRDFTGKGFLKCYFLGNAYSRYNPYFIETGVDLEKITQGTIIAGDTWAIQSYRITDALFNKIKESNPLYNRDDAYTNYALKGDSTNDNGIKIFKMLNNFKLFIVCEIFKRKIGIFKNEKDGDIKYHCQPINYDNLNKNIYCFSFEDLLNGDNMLYSKSDGLQFALFKIALRRNQVAYSDIATYYDVREIYNYI